ncbi:hypothetical protein NDU88_007558 [Pleurodeles waltl]|uniref:Uncharacterized protein n=1 Tax=Pleurodeles waltl TaxID=8319 RepID=A0AAV7VU64_PLEWA|nr:hypothetical protein NDU88_007558 [Pleurodeles waltl]
MPAGSAEGELPPAVCWGRLGLRCTFVGPVRRSLRTAALQPCTFVGVSLVDLRPCGGRRFSVFGAGGWCGSAMPGCLDCWRGPADLRDFI